MLSRSKRAQTSGGQDGGALGGAGDRADGVKARRAQAGVELAGIEADMLEIMLEMRQAGEGVDGAHGMRRLACQHLVWQQQQLGGVCAVHRLLQGIERKPDHAAATHQPLGAGVDRAGWVEFEDAGQLP